MWGNLKHDIPLSYSFCLERKTVKAQEYGFWDVATCRFVNTV